MDTDLNFEFIAGNLALDFTNTIHSHGLVDPRDDLKEFSDLLAWAKQAGRMSENEVRQLLRAGRLNPATAARDFKRARGLRTVLYDVFSSIAVEGSAAAEALERFNPYMQAAMGTASVQKSGEGYELGWANSNPFDRLLGVLSRAGMDLLLSDKLDRVRRCGGETCSWVFLDTSRSGVRRWCDMRACGNRAKIRRFRQRETT